MCSHISIIAVGSSFLTLAPNIPLQSSLMMGILAYKNKNKTFYLLRNQN
jgi:hypothetical protein